MVSQQIMDSSLSGRTVALPETRQLDLLAEMFEKRGARVVRTPLVAILDSPRQEEIEAWLQGFIESTPQYLVVLTGEGIRRLRGFASRAGCLEEFTEALSRTIKICRGPKPGRALKELGLKPDLQGREPTTPGIIATLDELELAGKTVGVQLYGEDPNELLIDYLNGREAQVTTVAPYIYAPQTDAWQVLSLIDSLSAGGVDIIAFTSQPQFARLLKVARENEREQALFAGLADTLVAAVGPVVKDQLEAHHVRVDVCPEKSFFMKPLVREIERSLND